MFSTVSWDLVVSANTVSIKVIKLDLYISFIIVGAYPTVETLTSLGPFRVEVEP